MSGKLLHNGKEYGGGIFVANGGSWLSGKDRNTVPIQVKYPFAGDNYFPILLVESQEHHFWNIGGYIDQFGLYGIRNDQDVNAPSMNFYGNLQNEEWTFHGAKLNLYGNLGISGQITMPIGQRIYLGAAGYNSIRASDNYLYLGATNSPGSVVVSATTGLEVKNGAVNAYKPVYAFAFTVSSSRKVKENFSFMSDEDARKLLLYEVVHYDYIGEESEKNCDGMIAEDIEKVYSYPVIKKADEAGKLESVGLDYSRFIPQMIKMTQLQQKEIDSLKAENESLKQRLSTVESRLEEVLSRIS